MKCYSCLEPLLNSSIWSIFSSKNILKLYPFCCAQCFDEMWWHMTSKTSSWNTIFMIGWKLSFECSTNFEHSTDDYLVLMLRAICLMAFNKPVFPNFRWCLCFPFLFQIIFDIYKWWQTWAGTFLWCKIVQCIHTVYTSIGGKRALSFDTWVQRVICCWLRNMKISTKIYHNWRANHCETVHKRRRRRRRPVLGERMRENREPEIFYCIKN